MSPKLSMITFHPSYSYEDFVEGYKPRPTDGRGGLELKLRDGIFKRICQAAAKDPRPYLLLIDLLIDEDYTLLGQLLDNGVVDTELQVIRPDVLQAPGEFVEALRMNFGTTD